MSYLIAVRVPGGKLVILQDSVEEATIAEFEDEESARNAAEDSLLCGAYGYELIEVEA